MSLHTCKTQAVCLTLKTSDLLFLQPSTPQSQHSTVDMTQLQDPHGFTPHSIQVQHIQVSEAVGTVQASAQVQMHQYLFFVISRIGVSVFFLTQLFSFHFLIR